MKSKNKDPIGHLEWINPKKFRYNSKKFDVIFIEHYFNWFNNNNLKNIKGNILQIGGGSQSGLISVILSKITNQLTILDYSLNMINIVKKTIKLNLNSCNEIKFVQEKMENYSELHNIDNIIFTFSMSFSEIEKTIKNLDKNCKIGCKILHITSAKKSSIRKIDLHDTENINTIEQTIGQNMTNTMDTLNIINEPSGENCGNFSYVIVFLHIQSR